MSADTLASILSLLPCKCLSCLSQEYSNQNYILRIWLSFVSCSGLSALFTGVAVVVVFAGGCAWIMFEALERYHLLRVDQVTELAGIDNMDHGGPAYPEGGGNTCVASAATNPASAGRRML